jgi:ATP/maltotriose-dependent transcriptional regulator MalT
MPDPILQTKLTIPLTPTFRVQRPRLVKQLNEGLKLGHRLLLVSAPPGYGKTTLLGEWVNQLSFVGWRWMKGITTVAVLELSGKCADSSHPQFG